MYTCIVGADFQKYLFRHLVSTVSDLSRPHGSIAIILWLFLSIKKKKKTGNEYYLRIPTMMLPEINERSCLACVLQTSGKSLHEVWCMHHDKGAHPQTKRKS